MKKKMIVFMTIASLTLLYVLSPFLNSVEAKELEGFKDDLEMKMNQYEKADIEFRELNDIKNEVNLVEKMVKNNEFTLHSNKKIRYEDVFVKLHIKSKEKHVHVPFEVEDTENQLNGFVVILDKRNNFKGITEMDISVNELKLQGFAKVWNNGELVQDKTLSLPKESFESSDSEIKLSGFFPSFDDIARSKWTKFNDCLNAQGVSWALITMAGAICSGACGLTFGAGCAPCFYGISFLGGATVGHCFQKAIK